MQESAAQRGMRLRPTLVLALVYLSQAGRTKLRVASIHGKAKGPLLWGNQPCVGSNLPWVLNKYPVWVSPFLSFTNIKQGATHSEGNPTFILTSLNPNAPDIERTLLRTSEWRCT